MELNKYNYIQVNQSSYYKFYIPLQPVDVVSTLLGFTLIVAPSRNPELTCSTLVVTPQPQAPSVEVGEPCARDGARGHRRNADAAISGWVPLAGYFEPFFEGIRA